METKETLEDGIWKSNFKEDRKVLVSATGARSPCRQPAAATDIACRLPDHCAVVNISLVWCWLTEISFADRLGAALSLLVVMRCRAGVADRSVRGWKSSKVKA
ncbi:hypothetical protein E2C01_009259 [Portunus trituberculatus]|uniref:Uncharacterized protein n=1 Tax=Portunus trituberculatus TaxID=210409 RepID=A0A5B7D5E8_PORTR|nr:hypothetical protein [Portunus trituberculatus]